jgi:hypothetical protein
MRKCQKKMFEYILKKHTPRPHNPISDPPASYKSSSRGLSPCADPILSSRKNLSLSTAALSPIHFANFVASVPGISIILG